MPGGVCAVLDYEVSAMAEYVAEMTVRVVTPGARVASSFRKFVTQILTSTRLPSTTILLGMNYLAKRTNAMKEQGVYEVSEGQVWRYLTVSLLLGSKFLDDNTFQNRSWSEVSGIAVSELNSLEFDWVRSMNWRLYVNLDLSKDYQAWLDSWREWQQIKKRQAAEQATHKRLVSQVPALNTDIARFHGYRQSPHLRLPQEQVVDFDCCQPIKMQQAFRPRQPSWPHNPWSAPLTPPDSGYGTPEYGLSATSSNARYNEWFAQAAAQYSSRYPQHSCPAPAVFPSAHHQTSYHNSQYTYGSGGWDHGLSDCGCSSCYAQPKLKTYFMPHGYGQPVVG